MAVEDISNLFQFLGGLGMFLYGMNIMGDGMQKTAGSKMNQFLGMVTNKRILGVVLGALITAILHSSAATTVMVVGFVNAGILNLTQAVGVIMGANIGTTITAWMVSLNSLGDAFAMLQPSFFAPLMAGIGAFFMTFSKKQKINMAGEIFVGVGLLFIGLTFMSGAIEPYTDAPIFADIFRLLGGNPILGIIAGAVITALLQSSTASVGILQTLAMNGVVTMSAAIYITLGQNIGTCVTAVLSSAGANRTAKRAAAIHLMFNTIGAILFAVGMYLLTFLMPEFALGSINAVQISMFHTIFNVTNTILLYPFANQLVKLSALFVKDKEDEKEILSQGEEKEALRHLDQRIFESPAFAIEVASTEVVHMGQITLKNIQQALDSLTNPEEVSTKEVYETEETIDRMEKMLTEYLIKVNNLSLNEYQKMVVNNLFYSISDIERVGDHAENLAESADYIRDHNVNFSGVGIDDLKAIGVSVIKSFSHAIEARRTGNMDDVRKVSQYEDEVDNLEEEMREEHIERLSSGQCDSSAGVIFLDVINNLERISDHAYNLAGYVKNEM
ncbi:MAG: Na/Pi cotransporter family protein [Lachnospiraceae bacterium]|jgi:phosphate:Na+ symporter|nr:Na/Pi cotransporter family protein [Lachnospiraceae bacterium]